MLFNSARTSEASGSSGRSATGLAISLEKKVLFNHIPPSPHPPPLNAKEKNAPSWEAAGDKPNRVRRSPLREPIPNASEYVI
jgi:hypothetical protein